jgi:hypothetical protein
MTETVARWQNRTGKWYVVLERFEGGGYGFTANGSGGALAPELDEAGAIAEIQRRADAGYFQPDNARTPMVRVDVPKPRGVYGEWCRDPETCEGLGYCPRDPTCAD